MRIAQIKNLDVANGPGVRVSVFVSGCTRHCPGCFNEVAQDFDYGTPYTGYLEDSIVKLLVNPRVSGLTVLGGEPFEPANQPTVSRMIERVRKEVPEKSIWVFTGYTIDELLTSRLAHTMNILQNIDVLVDGPFRLELKNLMLKYRGSENQRLIDVRMTLDIGKVVLWQDKYD